MAHVLLKFSWAEYWDGVMEALPGALANTVIGICVVFAALLFISFIISRFKYISVIEEKLKKRKEAKQAKKAGTDIAIQAIENTVAQIEENETLEELEDDSELVAVIMAAIYAYEAEQGNSYSVVDNGLVVRSIRKAAKGGWQNA